MTLGEVLSQHSEAFTVGRDDKDSLIIRTQTYLDGICLSDLVYFDQYSVADWDGQRFLAARFIQEFPDTKGLHLLPIELQPRVRRLWERIHEHIAAAVDIRRQEAAPSEAAFDVCPVIDSSEILENDSPVEGRWYDQKSAHPQSEFLN